MPSTSTHQPIAYRDRQSRVWYVSEVARLKLVSASIDGPNHFLMIRFEYEGEERFARWIGGDDWVEGGALHRLFAAAEPLEVVTRAEKPGPVIPEKTDATGVGPAPPETVQLWCERVVSMGPDEIDDFERRTFAAWDRASLGDLRRAIQRRRRELAG